MLDMKLMLNSDIVLRNVGNKYWALDTKNGNQYKLNEVSFFILNVFRKPKFFHETIEIVAKEYDVDIKRLYDDCNKVLQYAMEKEIIKEV